MRDDALDFSSIRCVQIFQVKVTGKPVLAKMIGEYAHQFIGETRRQERHPLEVQDNPAGTAIERARHGLADADAGRPTAANVRPEIQNVQCFAHMQLHAVFPAL